MVFGTGRVLEPGEGGDKFCGRVASELPLSDVTFANLPAHLQTLNDEEKLSSAEWEITLPRYSTFYLDLSISVMG